jgi:hypothetical protein
MFFVEDGDEEDEEKESKSVDGVWCYSINILK